MVQEKDFIQVDVPAEKMEEGWAEVLREQQFAKNKNLRNARGLRANQAESEELTERILCDVAVYHWAGLKYQPPPFENRHIDIPEWSTHIKWLPGFYKGRRPLSLLVPPDQIYRFHRYISVYWPRKDSSQFILVGWCFWYQIEKAPLEDPPNKDGTPRNSPAHFLPWLDLRPMNGYGFF